jgi:hypothetical protein
VIGALWVVIDWRGLVGDLSMTEQRVGSAAAWRASAVRLLSITNQQSPINNQSPIKDQ